MSTQCSDPAATEAAEPVSRTGQPLTAVSGWQAYLTEVAQRLRPYFVRRESWQRAVAYIEGLFSSVARKNAWQLAEVNGDTAPYGIQHLSARSRPVASRSAQRCPVRLRRGAPGRPPGRVGGG